MRRRTPRFVTPVGLGDGHAGRDKQQDQQGSHGQLGYHNGDPSAPTAADDIFRIAKQKATRRNNNPNNQQQLRLRPTTNERLVRMTDADEGRERRWDVMFVSSSSGDAHGKIEGRLVSNMHEHWELSMTLICVLVLISALFLHLLSSDAANSSHHHNSHHSHHYRPKPPRGHRNRRKGSNGTTRKKKTDEWESDESASEEEEALLYRADSDGQASTSTPKKGEIHPAGTMKPNLFYPYQPRHRKPSAGGKTETYGATYSPIVGAKSDACSMQGRHYYLTPNHGPVIMPTYQSPTPSSTSLQGRLLSPARVPMLPIRGTAAEPLQGAAVAAEIVVGRSPKQPHALATPLTEEFIATGLEHFDVGPSTPHQVDMDEESQHPTSESGDQEATPTIIMAPPKIRNAMVANQSPSVTRLQSPSPVRTPVEPMSYTYSNNNSYTAYGSVYSNNLPDGSVPRQPVRFSQGTASPQHPSSASNHSNCMLSPRIDSDMSNLVTPKAGMQRRTVGVAINGRAVADGSKCSIQAGSHDEGVNNDDDPFHILKLPSAASMGSWNVAHPYAPLDQGELDPMQRHLDYEIPMLPMLDPGAVADRHEMANNRRIMPQSISVEELRLVQMESGSVQWFVEDAASDSAASTSKSSAHVGGSASDRVFVPSTDDESEEFVESNGARKAIKHKRPNITDDSDAASSLQSSIKFQELNLIEVIGGGGFGQVWKAFWRGTPVAVKVLTGSAQAKHVSKAILEEFAAEINLLSGMRHPNICLYMGACVDPPNRAIITELAANGSLWDALRLPLNPPYLACDGFSRHNWPDILYNTGKQGAPPTSTPVSMPPVPPVGSWPWILVKHVAWGTARGMSYLHSGNPPILHRDLKSANILLSESYTAKVCDFGLSRLKAQERSMTGNCGTVQWMAPEVLANQRYNEKADIYSYGIILTELLTRECPFDGMSAIQCALAVLNRDQRPEVPKWCPPQLKVLIKSCVKKSPDERPTFIQIIETLDAMP